MFLAILIMANKILFPKIITILILENKKTIMEARW